MGYERPTIEDYGTLVELTAGMNVGGPEDALHKGVGAGSAPPGHSCPTGPPGALGGTDGGTPSGQCHVMNNKIDAGGAGVDGGGRH